MNRPLGSVSKHARRSARGASPLGLAARGTSQLGLAALGVAALGLATLVGAGAGCTDDGEEKGPRCADGSTCEVGTVCVSIEASWRCVLPELVEACVGLDEGQPCAYPGSLVAFCREGVCLSPGTGLCGDGVAGSYEECDCGDGTVALPAGCAGPNSDAPDAPCRPGCTLRRCGDGVLDSAEVCDDGNNVDGDGCSAGCTSDETCGNGVRDPAEECDDGNAIDADACHNGCLLPRCGDAVVDLDEACDDGNGVSGDGCDSTCSSNETCGNGYLDVTLGELCDEGAANSAAPDAACRPDCTLRRCGDGVADTGEACDDGNASDGDGCSSDCLSNETCGNGVLDYPIGEVCDDGNTRAGDGCAPDCTLE